MSPLEVRNSPEGLVVTWPDKVVTLTHRNLRGRCPCAVCQGHGAGPRKFIENQAHVVSVKAVGHYALQLGFDDGHTTGLYTFEYLREMS